ncbi:MAG: hypothetical protein JWL87_82 [Candidatus Adlerbacteria bacterium]|nr:hypothetical protein [Candidatus Adlerbacteria bacterium]
MRSLNNPLSDGSPYHPNSHGAETTKTYPARTIVVLDTGKPGQKREYRLAILTRRDFEEGLRCQDGISLNRRVAERCFSGNTVYTDEDAAKKDARALVPAGENSIGIKILQFHQEFPGID